VKPKRRAPVHCSENAQLMQQGQQYHQYPLVPAPPARAAASARAHIPACWRNVLRGGGAAAASLHRCTTAPLRVAPLQRGRGGGQRTAIRQAIQAPVVGTVSERPVAAPC
jgi:hypothetical protein